MTLTKEAATIERLLPEIKANHREFKKSGEETVKYARQLGDLLLQLKECVKHGEWEGLIEQRCDFTSKSAAAYMKLAAGWKLLGGKAIGPDATIGGCLKLIGQAKPKGPKGGKSDRGSDSPIPASSGTANREGDTTSSESESEPDASDTPDDGPLNDEPVKELTFEERVKDENGKIESFCRQLMKFYDDNCPAIASIDHLGRYDSALGQIRAACSTLRTCKYHDQPCPKCCGEGCSRCAKESDFGAVTVLTYRQLAG